MAKVDGFNVMFTHRGSWKADLLAPGKEAEIIPVAWKTDWDREEKTLFVWLKTQEDVDDYMARKEGFHAAVGVKNEDGSTSSNNIVGIFWVKPLEASDHPRLGVNCAMVRRSKPTD